MAWQLKFEVRLVGEGSEDCRDGDVKLAVDFRD
jgi:hypothetical protein